MTKDLLIDGRYRVFPEDRLRLPGFVELLVKKIADKLETKIVETAHYRFRPQGLTFVAIIAESHIIVHTWPEKRIVQVDISCCKDYDEKEVADYVRKLFEFDQMHSKTVIRPQVLG